MTTLSVVVKDSGMRSFVPPSFSWNMINPTTGQTVGTVSDVDLTALGISAEAENDLRYAMMRGEIQVIGHTKETDPHAPSGQRGRVLIVERVQKLDR